MVFLLLAGCGTTLTVKQPLLEGNHVYKVKKCEIDDLRATEHTCTKLKNKFSFELLKKDAYELEEAKAPLLVNLKITYYRYVGFLRSLFGIFVGKDGMDIDVEVVDPQDGKKVGSAEASTFNYSAISFPESSKISSVAEKAIEFLVPDP